MTDSATDSTATFFFHCSACGKCCNSPPAMTLPELFHHQERFFGCLALRRVARIRPGTLVANGSGERRADDDDALEAKNLVERVLHSVPGHADCLLISGQAFGYPSQGRCPALNEHGRCGVHQDRKPLTCGVVPLDALLPDRLQHAVVSSRSRELGRLGSDCLRTTPDSEFSPITHGAALLAEGASEQLAAHRSALALEKRFWGSQVFATLVREGSFDLTALPPHGSFELSLAPALLVLATVSRATRERCISYLDAQAHLGERIIEGAIRRKSLVDRPVTERLRAFIRTNKLLRDALGSSPHSAWTHSGSTAHEIERWLEAPSPHHSLEVGTAGGQ